MAIDDAGDAGPGPGEYEQITRSRGSHFCIDGVPAYVAARRDDPALRAYVARCAADPDPTVRREAQAALARTAAVPAALAPSPTSPDSKEAPAP